MSAQAKTQLECLNDALEWEIGELEALAVELQPPPEENAAL